MLRSAVDRSSTAGPDTASAVLTTTHGLARFIGKAAEVVINFGSHHVWMAKESRCEFCSRPAATA